MTELFLKVVNMSITAGILAVVVMLLRLILKKAPRWMHVLLWGLVAVRLMIPVPFESSFSLMPQTRWIEQEPVPTADIPQETIPTAVISGNTAEVSYPAAEPEIQTKVSTAFVLSCIWLAGMTGLLLYAGFSYVRVYRRVQTAFRVKDNVWWSPEIPSPFVFGIFRPKIYLPLGITEEHRRYVIAHEKAHIRRHDHWWKPLGFLLLTVHWFNPVLWLAYVLLCRDIEMACDERVVKEYDMEKRADYSAALLRCSVKRSMISACPLAFGEADVKTRIKAVLNYRKPAVWMVVMAGVLCIAVTVCFLTNPIEADETSAELSSLTLDDVIRLSEKGESLTWEDFAGYKFIETGSGIYIRVYEIDETFDLMIGDGDFTHFRDDGTMTGTPWYIRLCADHWENYADVTKDDVAAFIAEHPYTTEPIGKSAGSETIQAALTSADGQLIFDNTVVSNVKPAAVCEYRYIPVPVSDTMRENLFEAYFGERADDVFCKDEQKDIWQLGETMSGVFYQYNTVPHVSGASVFTVRYSVPNLIPFDDNRKGSGEPSGCTITAEEAAALCEPLLGSMTDITRYKIDYAHHYGNNGENPFYWICYKRILDGLTVNAFKDIYFFVDDNGVEKINGAFYDTEKTEEYTDYLTAEEAVDALAEQLDEVNWKEAGTSEIARIGLEYVTVKDSSGRITIVPIWRMELGNSEEERILNRNRILGIHAGTGELIQDWIGMGRY